MGFVVLIVIIVIVIALFQTQENGPQVEEAKKANASAMDKYLANNNVSVTAIHIFENEYYRNNISYEQGISCKFVVDGKNKKIHLFRNASQITAIPFDEIIGCEIVCDSEVVGGVGRAIVGGMIAGGAGAIVGAVTAKKHITSYKVVVYCSSLSSSQLNISLISQKTETKSSDYRAAVDFAAKVNASIKAIMAQNVDAPASNTDAVEKTTDEGLKVVVLTGVTDKVQLMKYIRLYLKVDLKEAKRLVETLYEPVCEPISLLEASTYAQGIVANGGEAEIVDAHHGEFQSKKMEEIQMSENTDETISTIEKLAELKDKGILTEEEFIAKKKQLLGL